MVTAVSTSFRMATPVQRSLRVARRSATISQASSRCVPQAMRSRSPGWLGGLDGLRFGPSAGGHAANSVVSLARRAPAPPPRRSVPAARTPRVRAHAGSLRAQSARPRHRPRTRWAGPTAPWRPRCWCRRSIQSRRQRPIESEPRPPPASRRARLIGADERLGQDSSAGLRSAPTTSRRETATPGAYTSWSLGRFESQRCSAEIRNLKNSFLR